MQPRFVQIKSAILDDIESGKMKPGDKVASENQLAETHSVSRMTARRALTELVDEGILLRSQGLGTFVSDHRPMSSMLTIRSIQEEILQRGHTYSNRILQQAEIIADDTQAAWLALPPGASLYQTQIIHLENQLPVQLENRLVNPALAPDYLQQNFQHTTANAYLSRIAPLTEADHVVEAIAAEPEVAAHLSMAVNAPCLKVSRRTYSAKGIVSYAQLLHPGDRYRLGGHLDF
ncbi:histidine utilization repressor [Marinibactrum halimedae]|uniref:Histidine utilization repressor n=1 Tax=Marinibactrum halimedae TaxID=1444977 RepID=A0AA37WNI5_9GAMM|nr:histidine utilization repressor [Marinibactrum halimedae]MCD9459361.1 histidine utilization repressor [Marinibactrum halimedae]GLS27575.1 histidine utilization repressor [Marinibactrum halimedae]